MEEGGAVLAAAEGAYEVRHPHPGWSEQDPADWIAAARAVIAELRAAQPQAMARLQGIGLSGQMHGAVLLGADHEPLRPCMLWNDTRASREAAALDTRASREIIGNIVFPGFTAPKVAWVAAHEPAAFARVAVVVLPKDHLRLWLTGEAVTEMSDAAGTGWLDMGARAWSDALLGASGMRRDQMPALVEGTAVSGTLRADLAADLGLPVVPVAGGGGDNAAAAAGLGTLREGQGFVSLGTSGVVLAARDRFEPAPETAVHSFCHAIPDTWYQMAVILSATGGLSWLARLTGRPPGDLAALMPERASGPGALRFAPYLSGERTPHPDGAIRGALLGLDVAHGAAELTRAVMEGVAFALRDGLDALRAGGRGARGGSRPPAGGARSPFWLDTLACAMGVPIDVPEAGEIGAALGAARLSVCAATGASPPEVMTPPDIARTLEPRADLAAAYEDAFAVHREAYPALKALGPGGRG